MWKVPVWTKISEYLSDQFWIHEWEIRAVVDQVKQSRGVAFIRTLHLRLTSWHEGLQTERERKGLPLAPCTLHLSTKCNVYIFFFTFKVNCCYYIVLQDITRIMLLSSSNPTNGLQRHWNSPSSLCSGGSWLQTLTVMCNLWRAASSVTKMPFWL